MKVQIVPGENLILTVKSPGGEVFNLVLEPEIIKRDGAYDNFVEEEQKALARREILAAAEKLKNPRFYAGNVAYNNLMSIEHGIGSSNADAARRQKESGMI